MQQTTSWVCLLCWCVGGLLALPTNRDASGNVEAPFSRHQHHQSYTLLAQTSTPALLTVHFQNSTFTIPGSVEIACPKGCLTHGSCDFSTGICVCDIGWYGADCMAAYACPGECNYHGRCISDFKCVCAKNFGGDKCQFDLRCPNNCSGHGTCNSKGTECFCSDGWYGEICSQREVDVPVPRVWTQLYPPATQDADVGTKPLPRHGHTGVFAGSVEAQQVLVWGGKSGDEPQDDMWLFDIPTSQWTRIAQIGNRPGPRFDHTAVSTDQWMFIFGGFEPCQGDSAYSTDLWQWSFENQTWALLPMVLNTDLTAGPVGRVGHSMVLISGVLYVFGGKSAGQITRSDTWSYAISSGIWSTLAVSNFGSRRFHSATAVDSTSFVVFGGLDADSTAQNDLHLYQTSSDTWTPITVSGVSPLPRFRHAAAMSAGQLYIVGGQMAEDGGVMADMWAIDPTNANPSWAQMTTVGDVIGIASTVGLLIGSTGVLVGGRTSAGDSADVWHISETLRWTKVTTVGDLPARRMLHSGNVVDGKLWIYGGINPTNQRLNDLWEFDLSQATWTLYSPSAVAAVDSAAAYTCGVVDVEEGDSAGVVSVESGVLWPSKRSGHSSVVISGSDSLCGSFSTLVIFGGIDANNKALNDLWYWCAGVQQWSSVPSPPGSGVPPRSTAGMTNIHNIVYIFGGMTADKVRLNDLWACQLNSGDCSLMLADGAMQPHTRRSLSLMIDWHTVSPQLLMFGGYWTDANACWSCGSVTRAIDIDRSIDVWKYELQYSRWRKIYANNAPEQRYCAGSFMADDRMLMFGGYSIDGLLEHNDLWYFHLDAQQWRRLPAEDDQPCPVGRHEHTFDKWVDTTGTFAVVYGGIGTNGLLFDVWIANITDVLLINDMANSMPQRRAVRHINA